MPLRPLCVKINLGPLYAEDDTTNPVNWEEIGPVLVEPIDLYLQKKTKIVYKSVGIHDFNKDKGVPHVHINYIVADLLPNPTANYKYFVKTQLSPETYKVHFTKCKHSIKHECYEEITEEDDIRKVLAYPMKEAINPKNMWKVPPLSMVQYGPYAQTELVSLGSGMYQAALEKYKKQEKTEDAKMEKWCNFCQYMDNLRETPTKYQMEDLRGVCTIALDYYRKLPERTSVNAVITMCKDYAFKRNIWTNNEILDKYQIN